MSGADFKIPEQREALIEMMESLLRSPGWAYIKATNEAAITVIINALDSVEEPHKAMRYLGELKQLRKSLSLPQMLLTQALEARRREQEKAKEKENGRR